MSIPRTCHHTVLALPWLLNGSLEPAERRQVRDHLIACPQCRAELARTRETLALFGGAERTAARSGTVAVLPGGGERRLAGGKVLRRLAWAAMIALVVSTVGGLWLGGRDRDATRPASTEQAHADATARAPQPAEPADVIFSTDFEGGSLASLATAPAAPALPPEGKQASRRIAPPVRIAAARTPPPATDRISSVDFESGDLGQWQ